MTDWTPRRIVAAGKVGFGFIALVVGSSCFYEIVVLHPELYPSETSGQRPFRRIDPHVGFDIALLTTATGFGLLVNGLGGRLGARRGTAND